MYSEDSNISSCYLAKDYFNYAFPSDRRSSSRDFYEANEFWFADTANCVMLQNKSLASLILEHAECRVKDRQICLNTMTYDLILCIIHLSRI